jgi:DnaJ family protein C protein 8
VVSREALDLRLLRKPNRAFKLNLANEGLEAKKKEEETLQRKRKAEDDKMWEETREVRVDSWRSFQSVKKKKKTKGNVLG